MPLRVRDLHKNHDVIRAAREMLHAHMAHETILPALVDVREKFPDVPYEYLICLWIGINVKDREAIEEVA